ncbi:RHS repeat domain-containing protein [Photobacterium profundum]|uniref:Teneurin-like YD-shell domain-containing protein n=1 Tax=Photobacterium profundum (strain SS9) TaxID=298386 RepID=Q6LUC4_PHOPR|nr:RHS repeat-associated core domain-containing protein [Photobacterium profundum]CAG19101.1 hypothetical protein PBPRA0680 [Photobacterium profundum SS9]
MNANTTARKLRFEWQGSKQLNTTWQDAWPLQYEYDQKGNRKQLILPDGQCLGYDYDSQQQLSAITLNGADVLKVQRDKLGRELKRHQSNGITQHCDFAIQDNALGRQQFSYDALNQLQAHHQNNTTTHYQFDSFGNPSLGNPDFEESESTNDRLQRYQSKLFDYDKCGNQATVRDEDSAQHRQFNGFNQLTQLSHNGRYSHYDYDALGRRSRKTTEQSTVDFLWDGDQLIGEHSQGQYRWYIYAPDDFTPLALIENGTFYYYHTDHLGTPHTVTNSDGEVVWQATYNALGCAFISIDIIHNPLRFQGQYHDQESGLHYNRFRYYDPSIGQFIHQDPIGLLGGINHYRYAPNPIQWVDPLGLSCKEGIIELKKSYSSLNWWEKIKRGLDIFDSVDVGGGLRDHIDTHTKDLQEADYVMVTSELSTYSSHGASIALISGLIPLATALELSSLSLGGASVYLDVTAGDDINEAATAGVVNSGTSYYLGGKSVSALPLKYEMPARLGFDAYGQIRSFLFREAASNETTVKEDKNSE